MEFGLRHQLVYTIQVVVCL